MKRNAVHAAIVALAAVLLLGSCDALFTNYFKAAGLGQVGTDRVANVVNNPSATDDEVVAALRVSITSDSFYASLAADPVLMAALETRLETITNAAASGAAVMTETIQTAFTTLVDIQIQTTRSMDIIRNFGSLLGSYMRATSPASSRAITETEIRDQLDALIPDDMTEAELTAAVNGIRDAWPYFRDMATVMRRSNPPLFIGMTDDEIMSTLQISILSALFHAFPPSANFTSIGAAFAAAWTDLNDNDRLDRAPEYYLGTPPDLEAILTGTNNNQYYTTIGTFATAAGIQLDDLAGQF